MRFLFILCFFIGGCVCVSQDVAMLSVDVAQVQKETSAAVIKSIDAEIKEMGDLAQIEPLENLKERLLYLSDGNDAIMRSMTGQLSMEELAGLIKKRTQLKEYKKP